MYGISAYDLYLCQTKLDDQKAYMLSQSYVNDLGEVKSLLDCSMSANFSPKYYSEIANRVNVLSSFSIDLAQVPVFLTITLNGCFRKALAGDYSTFKAVDRKYLPEQIKYKVKNDMPLNISDLVIILNHQWRLFFRRFSSKFKNLSYSYIRCFEPHKKDGVPHIHALFYIPAYAIDFMKQAFKDIFNAPQNLKTDAITAEQERNGELNGFQTSINNPSGYVMKYIQKTFINLNTTQSLDDLSAWYVKHKVRRFLSSRTKVPLWVYRKINFISSMQDLYHLNDAINDEGAIMEWDKQSDYIYLDLPARKERLIYDNGKLEHYICDRLIHSYDKAKPAKYKSSPYRLDDKLPKSQDITARIIDKEVNRLFKHVDRFFGLSQKPVSEMKDYELVNYYQSLGGDVNPQHLAYVENIMLDRNLDNFTRYHDKHDLNNPDTQSFIDRYLICEEF
ncbi:MAG: hypothetical protein LUC34_02870 [Campylobacter sp.]|nr:hypothetical protein [Campylobacter sp.]